MLKWKRVGTCSLHTRRTRPSRAPKSTEDLKPHTLVMSVHPSQQEEEQVNDHAWTSSHTPQNQQAPTSQGGAAASNREGGEVEPPPPWQSPTGTKARQAPGPAVHTLTHTQATHLHQVFCRGCCSRGSYTFQLFSQNKFLTLISKFQLYSWNDEQIIFFFLKWPEYSVPVTPGSCNLEDHNSRG